MFTKAVKLDDVPLCRLRPCSVPCAASVPIHYLAVRIPSTYSCTPRRTRSLPVAAVPSTQQPPEITRAFHYTLFFSFSQPLPPVNSPLPSLIRSNALVHAVPATKHRVLCLASHRISASGFVTRNYGIVLVRESSRHAHKSSPVASIPCICPCSNPSLAAPQLPVVPFSHLIFLLRLLLGAEPCRVPLLSIIRLQIRPSR